MEKAEKLAISQSLNSLSKHRINAYINTANKDLKNNKLDMSKQKLLKPVMKNILKSSNLMNNTEYNKKFDSSINKTNFGAPTDSTAYVSCISTPKSISKDRKPHIKKTNHFEADPTVFINKIDKQVKNNKKINQQHFKITFTVNKKFAFQKQFGFHQNMQGIKKIVLKQIKKYNKIKNYYGIVGFYSTIVNLRIDKMLSNPKTVLEQFKQKGILELYLKILLAKQQPDYASLQFCDFKLIKYLGSGGFSKVYLARCGIDGKLCALKFIQKSSIVSEHKFKMLQNEKDILFTINHKRLVDLYYAVQSKNYIIFGIQFCPNGNLYQYIQNNKSISEEQAKFLMRQIIEGLGQLHSQKILFRDMKLQNILFDQNGNIKITDFGLSKPQINQQEITYSYCGSPEYMAPQMLAKTGHSFQIDHYALGILLYQLLYGKSPFYAAKKQDIFYAIMNSEPQFPKVPVVSKQVKSLIKGLLEKNPKYRIGSLKGIQQIINHPWFRSYSTFNSQSPFLIKLSQQNIQVSNSEVKNFNNNFADDINLILKQKIFFSQNYVNKQLAHKTQIDTIKFDFNKIFQKIGSSLQNKKKKIR